MKSRIILAAVLILIISAIVSGCKESINPTLPPAPTQALTPDATQTFVALATAVANLNATNTAVAVATLTQQASLFTFTATPSMTSTAVSSGTYTQTPEQSATFTLTATAENTVPSLTITPTSTQIIAGASATHTATVIYRTLTTNITGSGSVQSSPFGIICPAICSTGYLNGTTVTLSALPGNGATFMGWGGACTGTGNCTFIINADTTVTASFVTNTYTLSTTKTGLGTGTVISNPYGIDCGMDCSESFNAGTVVSLSAAPDNQSDFAGWGGACSGTGDCLVTMSSARAVTASFSKKSQSLTVTKTGTGGGTVTSNLPGISCGATCTGYYGSGSVVTLTGVADSNSVFSGWSGACTGIGTCVVTVDSAKNVSAAFTKLSYALNVIRSGNGTVASDVTGIYCGIDCSQSYDAGTVINLTAVPDSGSTFTGWTGACTGTGACSVTMDAAKTVSATFTP